MKKIFLIYLFLTISTKLFSNQNRFIGVWQEIMQDSSSYLLFTDKYCYDIYDYQDSVRYYVGPSQYYGFIDDRDVEFLSPEQLKDSGNYFVLAKSDLVKNEEYDISYFLIYETDTHSKNEVFSSLNLLYTKHFIYTKVEKFDERIELYLEKNFPEIFREYLKIISLVERSVRK